MEKRTYNVDALGNLIMHLAEKLPEIRQQCNIKSGEHFCIMDIEEEVISYRIPLSPELGHSSIFTVTFAAEHLEFKVKIDVWHSVTLKPIEEHHN